MKYFYKTIRPKVIEMKYPKGEKLMDFHDWLNKKLRDGFKVRVRYNTPEEKSLLLPIANSFSNKTFYRIKLYNKVYTFEKIQYIPTKVEESLISLSEELIKK